MPTLLKKIIADQGKGGKGAKRFPRSTNDFPFLKVSDFEKSASPGGKTVTFKAKVKSETKKRSRPGPQPWSGQFGTGKERKWNTETVSNHITFVRFHDLNFSEREKEGFKKVRVGKKDMFAEIPDISKNPISLKCSCDDFRFALEKQHFDAKNLIGIWRRYKRATDPAKRVDPVENPNPKGADFVNPANRLGICKHIFSLLAAARENEEITGRIF